jgi:hypothetical protein
MAYRSHHFLLHCAVMSASIFFAHSLRFLFFYLLCSLRHVPSMHYSPSVHFYYYALPHSSHLKHTQQPPFLIFSTFLYSLCTFCMRSPSCSSILYHMPSPPHWGVFSTLLFHNYLISRVPRSLTLFYISCSFRVFCLIIMVTLQLLCWFQHVSIITGCYFEIP